MNDQLNQEALNLSSKVPFSTQPFNISLDSTMEENNLVWCSDLHLNLVSDTYRWIWASNVLAEGARGLIVSGDISDAKNLERDLEWMADTLRMPIYFVLGNHDFYGGSRYKILDKILPKYYDHKHLRFLEAFPFLQINEQTCIIGCSGWADGITGSGSRSKFRINDFQKIEELQNSKNPFKLMREWSDDSVEHIKECLVRTKDYENVIVVTHFPVDKSVCYFKENPTSEEALPFFVNSYLGEELKLAAEMNPKKRYIVLCGHTHHNAHYLLDMNLEVFVGGVDYRMPGICGLIY